MVHDVLAVAVAELISDVAWMHAGNLVDLGVAVLADTASDDERIAIGAVIATRARSSGHGTYCEKHRHRWSVRRIVLYQRRGGNGGTRVAEREPGTVKLMAFKLKND